MSSKVKTIIGILLLVILLGGAYVVYNQLSNQNLPDGDLSEIALEDIDTPGNETQGNDSPENGDEQQPPDGSGDNGPEKLQAFDFTVYDADGAEAKLSDFYGKPIIINFWATWCQYCVDEMPLFEEKYKKYEDDIHFLMVNCIDGQRETKEKGQKFIEDKGYTFPVYYDTDFDAATVYEVYSMPTTVFIDQDGYIIAYQPGMLSADMFETGVSLILE